jgi:O-glycosyl hydrolase/fibronectin type 3 domain-containing protein
VKRSTLPGGTPGADSIWLFDPSVFVDEDGTPYLYFGGGGGNQARYIQLATNMYDAVGSAVPIYFPDFFEASHMHKYNGVYYYSYADNYDSDYTDPPPTPGSHIAYMTGPSPTGPFTYQGSALGPPPSNYGNNNHHTFFTYQGQWYCVYHNRYQATLNGVSTTEHRNLCMDRMYYNPDGTIQPIIHTQDGLAQLKNLDPFSRVEAETFAQQSGIKTQVCSEGGKNVTSIDDGDWIRIRGVDFGTGAGSFLARTAGNQSGGNIELRLDSLNGALIGTCPVPNTGGMQTWVTTSCNVSSISGVHDLYLKFTGTGTGDLFNLNWWQFQVESLILTAVQLDPSVIFQTIEGLGGAICFYNGWFTAHPFKQELFDYAFSGLNLSMLRIGNWWRGVNGQDTAIYEIVAAANQRLSRPVPICISSWSPPAYLKSNGQVGNGGTLIKKDGAYDYAGFAEYWYSSLQDYIAHGVKPAWITIQNEPDWTADYDSCRFDPTEGQYASFALAQEAVYNKLQSMALPPKLLGPDCVGLYGNAAGLRDYMAYMNPNTFYGIAHHLYGGSTDGTPDGYNSAFTTVLNSTNTLFPGKPRFMTEFGDIKGLIPCANLIHNTLVVEQAGGYSHWSLIWPGDIGLVEIEFPWGYYGQGGEWTNPKGYWLNPSYWSMKHYSYFIEPGFMRIGAGSGNSDILVSSYLSPNNKRLVAVLINRSATNSAYVTLNSGSYGYDASAVYQTTSEERWAALGPVIGSQLTLPVSSLTTVIFDRYGPVAPTGLSATAIIDSQINLTWTGSPGSSSYNMKRSSTSGGPYTTIAANIMGTSFSDTTTVPGQTYYYVVSANTLDGESPNSSEALPARVRMYLKLNETSGHTAYDAAGNGWNGTLVNGPVWAVGKYNNAVDLDGSNDFITLPAGVVQGLTSFSISAWVYLDVISNWSRIFDFGTGTTVNMFLTPRNGSTNKVRFAVTTGGAGGEQQINGSSALSAGVWTHVAVTLAGNTGILYVNGSEVGRNNSMTLTPDSMGNTTQNYIGRSQYSADAYLNGRVDEFRIYETALNAVQVAALYAEQIPDSIPSTPTSLSAMGVSGDGIDLTWNASDNATNYNLKRSAAGGGPYTLISSMTGTSYRDTGLSELTRYFYVVSAVNSAGESGDSDSADAMTQSAPPAVPTGLTASAGDRLVALNWDANSESDLAGYNVYRSTNLEIGYALLNESLLDRPEYEDHNVANYTTYYYVVTAVDIYAYESDYSCPVEAVPTDGSIVLLNAVDFEFGLGDWINVSGEDTHDWTLNTGGTLTPNTGPTGGACGSDWYVYLETSPGGANFAGDSAILESPEIPGFERTLTFFYHMYGIEIGTLNVDVYDGVWHNAVWSRSGQQHASAAEEYAQATVDLAGYTGLIRIRFRAVAAGGPRGDIAIDDIKITGKIIYGDMNADNIVNASDLPEFIGVWLQENCNLDLNGDCMINLYEFAEFACNWLNDFFQ